MWVKALDNPPKEGSMVEVSIAGQDLFVALSNGKLYCAQNRCPHEEIKLTLGCLKGRQVKCSLHGFSFDLVTGDSSDEATDKLKLYPVKQDNQQIYIEV